MDTRLCLCHHNTRVLRNIYSLLYEDLYGGRGSCYYLGLGAWCPGLRAPKGSWMEL